MEVFHALSGCSSVGCVCTLVSINRAAQECLDTKGCFWLLIKYFMSSFFLLPFQKERKKEKSSAAASEGKQSKGRKKPLTPVSSEGGFPVFGSSRAAAQR